MDSTKPLLFLDVDGVLNGATTTFQEHLIDVPRDEMPRSPFVSATSADVVSFRVRLDNSLDGLLAELGEHYELVWATTWESLANKHLSPLLGLGELGTVELSLESASDSEVFHRQISAWKWRSLMRYAGGRAFAFVDDDAGELSGLYPPGRGLWPIVVVPEYILSRSEVEVLVAEAQSTPVDALDATASPERTYRD
jgi:hypothetical protein